MSQGGGFPTIPTTPVGGSDLLANKATTYKDYECTKVIATGSTKTFAYIPRAGVGAVTITVGTAVGDSLDFYVSPAQLTAANDVLFLCNPCDCNQAMSGTTALGNTGYGGSLSGGTEAKTWQRNTIPPSLAPVIIGGEGLNN